MKTLKLLVAVSVLLIAIQGCQKEHPCQNLRMKKRHSGVCTADCPGVIGCDGKIYCNECDANSNGIKVLE